MGDKSREAFPTDAKVWVEYKDSTRLGDHMFPLVTE